MATSARALLFAAAFVANAEAAVINSVAAPMGSMMGGTYLTISGSGFANAGVEGTTCVWAVLCSPAANVEAPNGVARGHPSGIFGAIPAFAVGVALMRRSGL